MPRPLTILDPDTVHSITNRCLNERFLLKPDEELDELIGSIVARALYLFPLVLLYNFVAMSNHVHFMLQGPTTQVVGFYNFVFSQIAIRVNELRGRGGPFWHGPCTKTPIFGEAAIWKRHLYHLLNPVKAFLCDLACKWIGFSTIHESLGGKPRIYKWVNWTEYNRACRGNKDVSIEDYTTYHEMRIPPMPDFADDPEGCIEKVKQGLFLGEKKHRQERLRRRIPLPTKAQLRGMDIFHRTKRPKKGRQPLCHASTKALREAWRETRNTLVAWYRRASDAYRSGHFEVRFPPNMFRPWVSPDVQPATG